MGFEFMNVKNSKNKHYNATESYDLIYIIDTIKRLKDNLAESEYSFEVNAYYEETLEYCQSFLQYSGGSTIPEEFSGVKIIEIEPIFFLSEHHVIKNFQTGLNFPLELIGEGSYAEVYKYKDSNYNRFFALKRAKVSELTNQELQRFQREFEVLEKLNSPYIIEVYNYDKEKNQYTMEYAQETLEDYINRNHNKLSIREKTKLIQDILRGFNYIHKKGYLHRDISYTNILIKQYDDLSVTAKISDFGLVKIEDSNLTRRGTDFKGSLNDIRLYEIGFENYKIQHETYAITRIINFILSGRTNTIANYDSKKVMDFFSKGIHVDFEQRYSSIADIASAYNNIKSELV